MSQFGLIGNYNPMGGTGSMGGLTTTTPSTTPSAGGGAGAGMIATSVISAIGDIAVGVINAKRAKNLYNFNAKMAELQGRMYKLSAQAEIRNIRQKGKALLSAQRAAVAKSGLAMEGSPITVMTKSQEEAELDVIFSQINADYGASLYTTQAGIERAKGSSAMSDAYVGIGKTILSTSGDIYKQYQLTKLDQGR